MRIVFFGTPDFAAEILAHLLDHQVDIAAVVTMPDRPKGRSRRLSPPPVKQMLLDRGIDLPIHQPEKASTPEMEKLLKGYEPDLFVVVGYGEIIKQNLLDIPRLDPINIHTSLLPAYRGAAPINRAIMAGERILGITIMEMVKAMDAGDIILQESIETTREEIFEEIESRLLALAKKMIIQVIALYSKGAVQKTAQDREKVTFAPKIHREDCQIDWQRSAVEIENQVRGLSEKPGAFALLEDGKRLKILKAQSQPGIGRPGSILLQDQKSCLVACGDGALLIQRVQPEGKKPMDIKSYLLGNCIKF
ncbi:MAG: methionyl-tRNA formyltransferase [Simkaniaceae bacterium]|nr:methionyl-tRNA formyltransferase [Simkaniaceae bacterium]